MAALRLMQALRGCARGFDDLTPCRAKNLHRRRYKIRRRSRPRFGGNRDSNRHIALQYVL
jgi:hypothetical protein